MKTRYEYIHFVKIEDKPKTSVWRCQNNKSNHELGLIMWYAPWRQYVFEPAVAYAVFNDACLDDISHFLGQLRALRGQRVK